MELSNAFFMRFRGLDRAHGSYTINYKNLKKNKLEGKGRTQATPPTIELWQQHLNGEAGLGIIPIMDDGTCCWGAIDIDIYSNFDILALVDAIKNLNLPLVTARTKSGGAHLYLFLKEPVDAVIVRSKLMEWAIALGHPNVEVFPKQVRLASKDDCGNWLNMPYFEHEKTTRYAYNDEHKSLTAQEFIDYALLKEITEDELKKIEIMKDDEMHDAPPCLQFLCKTGFPEGTRNNGLFNLSVLARQKFGDDWQQKVDEYNREFLSPPLKSSEVQQIIRSVNKKAYFYRCSQPPVVNVCNRVICLTRKYGIGNASDDLGVTLNGLTKIETTPPTWIVAINGVRIELNDTDCLLSQASFRLICVEKINILPNRVKSDTWEKLVKGLLDHLETIEAPEDASPIGQLLNLVEEFCLSRAKALNKEEILRGKPYKEDGYTYFRSLDLIKFLSQRRFKEIEKPSKIWNILRERGALTKTLSIAGKNCRVWCIPSPEEQDKPFTIPDITQKEEF